MADQAKDLNKQAVDMPNQSTCPVCGRNFARDRDARRHRANCGENGKSSSMCGICLKVFTRKDNLLRHMRRVHASSNPTTTLMNDDGTSAEPSSSAVSQSSNVTAIPIGAAGALSAGLSSSAAPPVKKTKTSEQGDVRCAACDVNFPSKTALCAHRKTAEHMQKAGVVVEDGVFLITSGFKNRIATYQVNAVNNVTDIPSFLALRRDLVCRYISDAVGKSAVKLNLILFAHFVKPNINFENEITDLKSFNTRNQVITMGSEISQIYEIYDKFSAVINTKSEEYQERESGWALKKLAFLQININAYRPIRGGSSYVPLPTAIINKKACINIQNDDNCCLAWSLVAALHPAETHVNRTSSYPHYSEVLNLDGISFPTPIKDLGKIENLNAVSINVYGLEYDSAIRKYNVVGIIYFTKNRRENHINLLFIEEGCKGHYVLIKNLSRLISKQISTRAHRVYLCDGCLTNFSSHNLLEQHTLHDCNKVCTIMPDSTKSKVGYTGDQIAGNILKFNNFERKMRVPFIVYADFESIQMPIQTCAPDPMDSSTTNVFEHIPYSFGYYLKCAFNSELDKYISYTGLDCPKVFIDNLTKDVQEIYARYLKVTVPMNKLSSDEKVLLNSATYCHICQSELDGSVRVADHCHLTGKFIGAAHSVCNLNYKLPTHIPVFFHNLSGYDAHLFIKEFGCDDEKIDVIPLNMEKYISLTKLVKVDSYKRQGEDIERHAYCKLRFLDSFRFMASSLDKLARNLSPEQMININKHFSGDQLNLVIKKGVFPYQYIDSYKRLSETRLPAREKFFNVLSGEGISEGDYNHACSVWDVFQCNTLNDYSNVYLKTDVLLLADIFENFRDVCMDTYILDPAHYYTAPGLSWDAMLKFTKIKLELLTDIDMHHMIRNGMRGGISQCSLRRAIANNQFLAGSNYCYNPASPTTHLVYWDANNLYGWAMSQYLPHGGFQWVSESEFAKLDFTSLPDDGEKGYILEVDIEYPETLHYAHNDLPFLAENILPPNSKFHNKKLIPNFFNKTKYIIHYRNLKQAVANGLIMTKIHRVIEFNQSDWLKRYIDMNTRCRQLALNDFQKDFYKLMNNSVFGKTMENVDKRVDIKLVNHWDDIGKRRGAQSLIAKPNFHSASVFSENLSAIRLERLKVTYNKPLYAGFCVLELSKVLMYSFYYDFMKRKYNDDVTLCYIDTDSLTLLIKTDNIYADMKLNLDKFDTSNFSPNNQYDMPLVNKAVLGLMKDENGGRIMSEFVGLRAKMYGNNVEDSWSKKIKGVKKNITAKDISGSDMIACLTDNVLLRRMQYSFRSANHTIYTQLQNKLALSPFDDKRFICDDGIRTLAWGHKDIPRAPNP